MPSLEQQLAWAERHQASYRPSQEIQSALGEVSLTLIIGPSSIGKSHIIQKVVGLGQEFSEAGSIVTRPARDGDPKSYRTGVPKEEMLERIRARTLVQYAVHPTSKEIYASDLEGFPTRFVLLPTLANSVNEFDNLGFKRIIPVGLLASVADWEARLKDREEDKDFEKRLAEARQSTLWIQEHAGEVAVLENQTGADQETAALIASLSKGQLAETLSNQKINELVLGILAVINARLGEGHE